MCSPWAERGRFVLRAGVNTGKPLMFNSSVEMSTIVEAFFLKNHLFACYLVELVRTIG